MRLEISWARLVLEGMVIVVSILPAFAVDAWWDGTSERRRIQEQQAQLHGRIRANQELMAEA